MTESVAPFLLPLDLATLQQLGQGAAFRQFQRLLEQVVADCQSRFGDERARTISLKFSLKPKTRMQEDLDGKTEMVFDGVALQIVMDSKLPTRKTIDYDCGVTEEGHLVFNPHSPLNFRQRPLPGIVDGEAVPSA